MPRHALFFAAPLALVTMLACWVTPAHVSGGQSSDDAGFDGGLVGAETATLKVRLEKDLRARRPQEFAFIARVIDLVEQDVLPLRLVNAIYLWARKKPNRPFQYFERGLRVRAGQLGIAI